MKLEGVQEIPIPRSMVWQELNNPETLRQCIPGCEQYVETSPGVFEAVVKSSIGPVTATFRGTATVLEPRENEFLKLEGKGSGGAAGFGKLLAEVRLEDYGTGTRLIYSAQAQVGGKLAQVGARLIQSVATRFVDDFFGRFNQAASASQAPASLVQAAATSVTAASPTAQPPLSWWRRIWRSILDRLGGVDGSNVHPPM